MIERYTRKEIRDIWEDYNRYSIWLNIELAAAEAMEKLKIIPRGVVRKVKSKARINVKETRIIFHNLNMPLLSSTMIEWINAVNTSHGINPTFSIGSQLQYPPQPKIV